MTDTFTYVYKDLKEAMQYLPWGILVGGSIALMLMVIFNIINKRQGKPKVSWLPLSLFCIYVCIIMAITFLSRENGSREGVIDLELFSTWGINNRNNAFVVENVLLFIPYGFLTGWSFRWAKNIVKCVFFGFTTSLLIEYMQLVTGRGYFQIDDILTNTLGMFIGSLLCTTIWLFIMVVRGHSENKK